MTAAAPVADGDDSLRIVLCEGPTDLAFWNGLLCKRFGCRKHPDPPRTRELSSGAKGKKFILLSPDGRSVEVFAVGGRSFLLETLAAEVRVSLVKRPIARLLLNYDPDTEGDEPGGEWAPHDLVSRLRQERDHGDPVAEGGAVVTRATGGIIETASWRYDGDDRPGVPPQQTLERLACAAVTKVHGRRGEQVRDFLAGRTDPPAGHFHKSAALSFMAGWRPEDGNFNFYQNLWLDGDMGDALEELLTDAGVWAAVCRFLGDA